MKAIIVAVVAMLAVGFVFSAVQPVYELKVLSATSSDPVSPEKAAELLFWPGLAFVLISTVITFGFGGLVAGRLAGVATGGHALVAASIPLVLTWIVVLTEPDPQPFGVGFVTVVGIAAAVTASKLGTRRPPDR